MSSSATITFSGYAVHPANVEREREAILDTWERNFPAHDRQAHEQRLRWYYLENPFGPARCWLLRVASTGEVVGTAGLGLRRLWHQCQPLQIGLASDFAVDKEHRSLQPALLLQKAVLGTLHKDVALIYGLPNNQSLGVFERLGYQPQATLQRWVKVLRVERYLRGKPWLRGLAPVVGPVVNLARRLVTRDTWTGLGNLSMTAGGKIDESFDDLWQALRTWQTTISDRSAAFLDWRTRQPHVQYDLLRFAGRQTGRLDAYAIGFLTPDGEWRLVDWVRRADVNAVAMLSGIVRHARRSGATSVSLAGLEAGLAPALLRRFGFKRRPLEVTLMGTIGPHQQLTTSDLARWYFLLLDEDYN